MNMVSDELQTWTFNIPAYRREAFEHKLDVANRRLARAGVTERFSASFESEERKVNKGGVELPDGTSFGGTEVTEPWFVATMHAFELTCGDYSFVAALIAEEAGYTVHCAPGQNLDGWKRPEVNDIHCDHCGTKRNRNRLYIIRNNATDELLQIGHNCIELYTGLSPKGLWSLTFDAELRSFASEESGGFGSHDYGCPVDKVLGYAFAFSDQGRSYRPARDWEPNPTASIVRQWLLYPPDAPRRSNYRSGGYEKALAAWQANVDKARQGWEYSLDESLIADIRSAAETLKAGTDYADNMAVILGGEYVSGRNVGILASLVSVYARERELAVKRASAPKVADGFLAPIKTRVKEETRIMLQTVRFWAGDYGMTTFMVGHTPDMHCVVWKASGKHDVEPGDVLVLSAFSVKAHEQYGTDHKIDQTVIKLAIIKEIVKAA
jgi:hypothetical protein